MLRLTLAKLTVADAGAGDEEAKVIEKGED